MLRNRNILFALSLSIICWVCNAQTREIDSIKGVLVNSIPDTNRISALRRLAYYFTSSSPDSSLAYAGKAVELSRELKFSRGEARSLRIKGDALESLGNFSQSLEAYIAALKIFEQLNDQQNQAIVYTCIGVLYRDQQDYRAALGNTLKAKAIMTLIGDSADMTSALTNIGYCYITLNLPDSALLFEQRAYDMAVRLDQSEYLSNILENLGTIHQQMGHSQLALKYYQQGIAQAKVSNDLYALTETYLSVGNYYDAIHLIDSASAYALLALQTARITANPHGIMDAGTLLARLYDAKNPIASYRYYKIADSAKSQLYSTEKQRQLQNLQYNEQERQRELAARRKQDYQQRRQNIQLMGIAGLIPILFLLLLLLTRAHVHYKIIDVLGTISALLLFEFVTLLLHPSIAGFVHGEPAFELALLMIIAGCFAPLHHRLLHWLKQYLARKAARHKIGSPISTLPITASISMSRKKKNKKNIHRH